MSSPASIRCMNPPLRFRRKIGDRWRARAADIDGDYLDGSPATRSMMESQLVRSPGGPGQDDPAAFLTDSIYVCAVAGPGHALYRDIRLSGNRLRGSWAQRSCLRMSAGFRRRL